MVGAQEVMTLFAQVTSASSEHKVETANNLLRSKHFNGESKDVYLGDVSKTLLSKLTQNQTPEFSQPPKFNEQAWKLTTHNSQLNISITSKSYWGFGLFNSGYLNIIELSGPIKDISRLVFDLCAGLKHNPWEFSHQRAALKVFDLKDNERNWKQLLQKASEHLQMEILAIENHAKQIEKKINLSPEGDDKERAKADLACALFDIDVAKGALADDNAAAVERALSRIEANLISADPDFIPQVEELVELDPSGAILVSEDESILEQLKEAKQVTTTHFSEDEDIPFVDLSNSSEEE